MATKKQEQLNKLLQDFRKEFRQAQREVTYEEALSFFRKIGDLIIQTRQQNAIEVAKMKEISAKEAAKLQEKTDKALMNLKQEVTKAFDKAFNEQQGTLNYIRDRIFSFEKKRERIDEQMIQDILGKIPELPTMPPDLSPEVNDIKEMLERLEKKIEEIDKKPARTGGGGGTSAIGVASAMKHIVKHETPSGDIDGANTEYTVTKPINAVLSFGINGQVIHPSEYTVSGRTITMDTAIDGALSGTVFEITYL